MKAVKSGDAPAPIGPYSQGVEIDGWLYCSGQIALDPKSGELVGGGVVAEARRVLSNLRAVLLEAGLGFEDVVKTTIYLVDLADFAKLNEVYGEFVKRPFPARATVGVAALPKGAKIEIDLVARKR